MADKIKCTVVAGAPNDCSDFLKSHIDRSSFILAADSGYVPLTKAGMTPDLIIADFDSATKPDFPCEIIVLPAEKAYTDTFNCVRWAVENGYKDIEVFNAIGSRFDHSYANLLCLDYCHRMGVSCMLTDAHNRLRLVDDTCTFKKEYAYFSLFAFGGDCEGVRIDGAYYTAGWYGKDALRIAFGEQCGVSNYVTGDTCTVSVEKGTLLLAEADD